MKKINLKKSVDFSKYVLNLFPEYKNVPVFKAAVPNGLLKVSMTEKGDVKIASTKDVVAVIDSYCECGHISYFSDSQYIFPKCTFSLEEIGNYSNMVMLTVMALHYAGIGSHLWIDDEEDCPWWNGYYKKSVDGNRIHFADSDVDALQWLKEIMEKNCK